MAQSQGHRPVTPVSGAHVLQGAAVRRWIALAEIVADQTRDLVDILNVFPVPDADTGTNVLLTLRSASDALHRLGRAADAAQVARAAADGAVRGARGNSGLLFSQALAAFADVCSEAPDPTGLRPVELVHVYEAMADTTWAAVSRPVSGTLLSVARDAATAARSALEEATASSPATLSLIAAAAAFGAQESVVETAGLGHGPVDAGGAAFMLLLTSLSDTIDAIQDAGGGTAEAPELRQGHQDADEHAPYTAVARQMLTDLAAGGVPHSVGPEPLGMSTGEFEVMYLLEATAVQAGQLRRDLELIGDSVGVVGTPDALGVGLYQVHVHTDTPRAALPHAGRARQICIHHLHPTALVSSTDEPPSPWGALDSDPTGHVVSFERLAARRAERKAKSVRMHPSQAAAPRPTPEEVPRLAVRSRQSGVGVIACTRAPGLIEQLARSDAAVVLNPDREGIARAAADLGASQVIVLPCDAGCTEAAHDAARFLAARSAVSTVRPPVGASRGAGGSARETAQAGTQSGRQSSQGIQLLVCDTDDEARVLAATVALAGRSEDAELADLARRAWSSAAGLRTFALNGAQADADAVARAVAAALRPSDELLTVIIGRNAGRDVGALAASAAVGVRGQVVGEDVEVAVHAGGQERPDVLIAIE